jgi:hypothetical protein
VLNKSLRIRQLPGAQPSREIVSRVLDEATILILQEQAEPDITIRDHKPPVPSDGLSLAEAFELFVSQHPDRTQCGDVPLEGSTIALNQFVEQPTWLGTASIDGLCRAAGLEPREVPKSQGRRPIYRARVVRVGEFQKELVSQVRRFVLSLVIHRFVQRILDGDLHATGIWEGDLASLERQPIPSDWWRRDIMVDIRTCEIWERTARNRLPELRRWSAVRVIPIGTKSVDEATKTIITYRSGVPGRRTSRHLFVPEFRRRADQGLTEPTLAAEARALAEWLQEKYPDAHPATPKTIANRLRPDWRSLEKKTGS